MIISVIMPSIRLVIRFVTTPVITHSIRHVITLMSKPKIVYLIILQ